MHFAELFLLMDNHHNINLSFSINHQPIRKQSSRKYLGVMLDDILSCKPQIVKLVHNCLNNVEYYSNESAIPTFQCSNSFTLLFSIPINLIQYLTGENKTTLLLRITLQNKAGRTFKYDKTTASIPYFKH